MAFAAENSTVQSRFIKPRSRNRNQPITVTPPNPRPKAHLPKPTSSTLFSSIFSTTPTNTHNASSSSHSPTGLTSKMNKLTSMAFNRLGCGSLSPVTLPDVIQSAADWEAKKARKQKRRKKKKRSSSVQALKKTSNNGNGASSPVAVEVVSDVFCAPPGIGFSSDAAFVDCVEPRRPIARRKHKKHSGTARRDRFPVLDSDPYNATPYHLLPQYFTRGLSENMMSGGRMAFEGYDQFGELRLDVDNMSYEELVDLSEKIGYVGTGLREEKLIHCLRKARLESTPLLSLIKCSICQDEYEANDEVGKLECGHCYHIGCIKPWLLQKNSCPICKAAAHST